MSSHEPANDEPHATTRIPPGAAKQKFPLDLSWENLSYSIGGNMILSPMTGRMVAGRSCGLMGASGSGKTMLLNALSGRLGSSGDKVLTGSVRLNDVPYDRRYRQLVGFVPQTDIIGPMSTPLSAFNFSLRTRCGVSSEEADVTVHRYIERLKLMDCRNTIVGIPGVIQGLSGGERKRTNIGMELISNSKLLLCDEPTSGLDSTTALMVVRTLQELAREEGCTVMFSAHQPTTDMLKHFDDLLLLCQGKVVYHGPMDKSMDYFESLGYVCPHNFTPTDFYMVLLQNEEIAEQLLQKWVEYVSYHAQDSHVAPKPPANDAEVSRDSRGETTCPTITDNRDVEMSGNTRQNSKGALVVLRTNTDDLASVDEFKNILGDTAPPNISAHPASEHPHHHGNPTNEYLKLLLHECGSSYRIQFEELTKRAFVFVYTDYTYMAMLIISHLFFATVTAAIFNNLTDNFTGVQDRLGVLFMCAVYICLAHAIMALNRFRGGKQLYIREQQVGAFSPTLYFIATSLADLPILIFSILLMCIIVYFSTGLYNSAEAFFYFFAVLNLCSVGAFGMGSLIGAAFDNEFIATAAIPLVQIPMLLCGGLLADNKQVRPYFVWLEKISLHRYSSLLLFHNEFKRLGALDCDVAKFGITTCALVPKRGSEVMPYLKFDDEQDAEWVMWLTMAVFVFIIKLMHLGAMHFISRSKSN